MRIMSFSSVRETSVYRHLCISVMFVELRTSLASSPRQYSNVLIYLWLLSSPRPTQCGIAQTFSSTVAASGLLKLNSSGTLSCRAAIVFRHIPLLSPCKIIVLIRIFPYISRARIQLHN